MTVWASRDVQWHVPGRKRPIAYSTRADSDMIAMLAEDGSTCQEIKNVINVFVDAAQVMQAYIDAGYGDVPLNSLFPKGVR